MKRKIVLLALLALVFSQYSTAQTTNTPDPIYTLGKIPKPTFVNGKVVPQNTTIEEILSNQKFVFNIPGWQVTSYTFSILPDKGEYIGPFTVHGPDLSNQIKDILKAHIGGSGKIFFEGVKVRGSDRRTRAYNSIILRYDH